MQVSLRDLVFTLCEGGGITSWYLNWSPGALLSLEMPRLTGNALQEA